MFYFACNHVWNYFKIISDAKIISKLFQRHWTCWTIFMSCNKPMKLFWKKFEESCHNMNSKLKSKCTIQINAEADNRHAMWTMSMSVESQRSSLVLLVLLWRWKVGETLCSKAVWCRCNNNVALDPRVIHHVQQRQSLIGVVAQQLNTHTHGAYTSGAIIDMEQMQSWHSLGGHSPVQSNSATFPGGASCIYEPRSNHYRHKFKDASFLTDILVLYQLQQLKTFLFTVS